MTNAFEYGDSLLAQPPVEVNNGQEVSANSERPPVVGANQPYLNLATFVEFFLITSIAYHIPTSFRMVVLADELLESFFEADLTESFHLEPIEEVALQEQPTTFLGGLFSTFVNTDDNKKMLNKFADGIGKTVGRHQVRFTSYV